MCQERSEHGVGYSCLRRRTQRSTLETGSTSTKWKHKNRRGQDALERGEDILDLYAFVSRNTLEYRAK
jgi:hypothetical protein